MDLYKVHVEAWSTSFVGGLKNKNHSKGYMGEDGAKQTKKLMEIRMHLRQRCLGVSKLSRNNLMGSLGDFQKSYRISRD